MGMYTEFHLNSELRENLPEDVLAILNLMVDVDWHQSIEKEKTLKLPNHPLFKTVGSNWLWMLTCDSYYFDATTDSSLTKDEPTGRYYLNIRCNLKNYNNEIQNFLDWIKPYLRKTGGEFLGFHRYEEYETPVLIYM